MDPSAKAPTDPSRRIKELDGLRGISVLFVIAFHTTNYSGYFALSGGLESILVNLGAVGVQVFFVISGFIITQLLMAEHRRTGQISLKGFYTRRFFRIIPAYGVYSISILLLAAVGVLVLKEGAVPQVAGFLVSALFLSDIFYPSWFWGHTWSLSVEEQFCVFFPLCFRIIFKTGRRLWVMAVFLSFIYLSAFYGDSIIRALTSFLYMVDGHFNWNRYLKCSRFFSYQFIAVGVPMAIFWKTVSIAQHRPEGQHRLPVIADQERLRDQVRRRTIVQGIRQSFTLIAACQTPAILILTRRQRACILAAVKPVLNKRAWWVRVYRGWRFFFLAELRVRGQDDARNW